MPTTIDFRDLWVGAPYSFTLLLILGGHEMAHYLVARYHGVRASLPWFIPVPAYLSVVGTFGAFIRIKGPAVRRSVLFDIGVAGPIASFVISAVALTLGLSWSTPSGFQSDTLTPFLIQFGGQPLGLGSNLLSHALAFSRFPLLIGSESVLLHPVAFAGWLGMLLTSLNLLPFGQLDGGHVLYSVMGDWQARVARVFFVALIPLGFMWWGWWLWAVVALLLGKGKLTHPSVLQPRHSLNPTRTLVAVIAAIIFLITFIPLPLNIYS